MFKFLTILVIVYFLTGCVNGNPSHKPHIGGEIEIITKSNQGICFIPNLKESELGNKPLTGVNFDIMKIDKSKPNIDNFIWETNVSNDKYIGGEVCLQQNDPFLKEQLINGTKYTVCMRGMSESLNQYVTFCQTFLYTKEGKILKTTH